MPSCAINKCKNNSNLHNKSCGITFHMFPGDLTLKKKWMQVIRDNRNDAEWYPSKASVVCSVHFEEIDMYATKGGYCRIKKTAIPKKVHLVNDEWCQKMEPDGIHPESLSPGHNIEHFIIKEEIDIDTTVNYGDTSDMPMEDVSRPIDQISKDDPEIRDSELESEFDTSIEYQLKKQVKKYKLRCKIQARKIKLLNQQVKRLKKKNATLTTAVEDLKSKLITEQHTQ